MKGLSDYELLEREEELEAIAALIETSSAGRGACLTIEGPAGVGKTRLLESARTAAQSAGFRLLAARAGEREREYSWGVARSLFEPVLLSADEREREALWSGPAAACRPVLEGGDVSLAGTPDSSFAIFTGFFAVARTLAAEQPLLLAVDDLHWVDGASLGLLEFVARRIEAQPTVIATTLRPNESGVDAALISSLTSEPHGRRLRPRALSPEGSATALRARLGPDLEPGVLREAHEVTGGNPLLLSELARTLEAEGGAGAEDLTALGSRAVSRNVEVRLSRAGRDGRRLAEAAAVLGEEALLGHAIELAGLDPAAASGAALDLVKLEVLLPGSRVHFVHPVVRAAIFDVIAAPERSRLHARATEILAAAGAPPERLANHLLEVDPRGDGQTVATLRMAAVKAAAGGDSRTATLLMRRALAEPPEEEQLTDVLAQLGAAELMVDGPSAVEHLGAALGRIREPPYLAAVTELLARALLFQERIAEAMEVSGRTLERLDDAEDAGLRRRLEAVLVETTLIEPNRIGPELGARIERLLRDAADARGDDYGSRAMLSLSALVGVRDLSMAATEVADRARRAAEGGVLLREGMNGGIAQLGPAQVLSMAGRCMEAIELLNESLRQDERFGSIFGHLSNLIFRGRTHLFAGSLPAATADTEESLRLSKAYRIVPGIAWSAAILAEALLASGEDDRARAVIEAEVPASEPVPWGWHWMNLVAARARLRLRAGDAEAALAEARRAGDVYAANRGVGPAWLSWRPIATEAALALGREGEAAALAEEELALARRWGAPLQLGRALRMLAAVDEDRREQLLDEAVGVLDASEARLELATALVDLGATRRRANRKAESRDLLRRGMDLAHGCGAAPLAERARAELRASGVRARRTALSGPESLTDSERRVVDLAVAGRSNREIAAELFVTVKTVEVHLSNAYRKLEIRGRRDLSSAMAPAV